MKSVRRIFKDGDKVRSIYASPWLGIIMGAYFSPGCDRYKGNWICKVLAVIDKNGNKIRRPKCHVLAEGWLRPTDVEFEVPSNFKDFLAHS